MDRPVVLVTGAASGIGRATAVLFAARGWQLVLADVDEAGLAESGAEVAQAGAPPLRRVVDVSRTADVEQLLRSVVDAYGRVDAAFNNAGIDGDGEHLADSGEECWDAVMRHNAKSVWLCMKYELAQMVRQGGGAIVNNASIAALRGFRGQSIYAASKAAVVQLTRTAAVEYAGVGIRINAVCPGATRTPMMEQVLERSPADRARIEATYPMRRMGEPAEVAELVLWLCSNASSFMTGAALPIDGGRTAQ